MIVPNKSVELSDLKKVVIASSVGTNAYYLSIGDLIQPDATGHAKFAVPSASSGLVLGVVVALEYAGKPAEVLSVKGVNTTSTAAGASSMNVHNDNETTGLWKAVYIPSHVPMEYKADLSAVADTTTDSGGLGVFFPVLGASASVAQSAGTLNEGAPQLFGGTPTQFVSYGVSTESASKVVGYIYKSL